MKNVMVATAEKGVYCGKLSGEPGESLTLENARMLVYWASSMRGVLNCAKAGPDRNCRVSPPVSRIKLFGVVAIVEVSDEAMKKWESEPWG